MTIIFVVPCGGEKADAAAPAADLYTGSAFRHQFAAAVAEAEATERDLDTEARVLILSALHGLVEPDAVLAPYDVKMGAAGSITAEALAETAADAGIDYGDEVYAMLPAAYRTALEAALADADVPVFDVYEAAPGIGYQRGVCSSLNRHHDMAVA